MGYNLDLYGLKKEEVDSDYVYDWLPKAQAYDWHNASTDSYTEEEGIITVISNKYSLHNMDDSLLLEIPVTSHTFKMIDLISLFHSYKILILGDGNYTYRVAKGLETRDFVDDSVSLSRYS